MSKIAIIAAVGNNLEIGKNNELLWVLPTDLKHFKKTTSGHSVVMGRKTWKSIPKQFRPLPNRKNYILSRDDEFHPRGGIRVGDLDIMLRMWKNDGLDETLFVIGGGEIYKESFKYADEVYLTWVYSEFDADTFLEGFNADEWVIKERGEKLTENGLDFRIIKYVKI